MTVRREDLTDIGDADYDIRRSELIRCNECNTVLGGPTRGDLWQLPMDTVLSCPCGSRNLSLVRKCTTYETVK